MSIYCMFRFYLALVCTVLFFTPVAGEGTIKLLILSGNGNHDWVTTTPFLKGMYEKSGVFSVAVNNRPDTLDYAYFSSFDVVVDNWNAWPERNCTWTAKSKNGLVRFVQDGGGLVFVHAAGAACYDWPEFREMAMATWGESTTHGKIEPIKLSISDKEHPVTNGIRDFITTDELWVETEMMPQYQVLCEAYSRRENKGRGQMEPVVFYRRYGKGICFYNILGHDVRAMRNSGWQLLTLRGTQWAAGKKVTVAPSRELQLEDKELSDNWHWLKTDTTIALQNSNQILWQYNFNTRKGKPFFHPFATPDGVPMTALSPEDHPWHLGLWHSWKYINGLNYWEYKLDHAWEYAGVTNIRDIKIDEKPNHEALIRLQLEYYPEDSLPVLTENRSIEIGNPGHGNAYTIDYGFRFIAKEKTVYLDRTPLEDEPGGKTYGGYAGLSARMNQDFSQPVFINSDGSTAKGHGKRFSWMYYGFTSLTGERVGICMMDHPTNPDHPSAWFVEDNEDHPFYYFSPACIFNAPITLLPHEQKFYRYRVVVISGEVDAADLQVFWDDFSKQ